LLNVSEPDRQLYLAVPRWVADNLFDDHIGLLVLRNGLAKVVAFDPTEEVIVRWIP
jgi:XisH protein